MEKVVYRIKSKPIKIVYVIEIISSDQSTRRNINWSILINFYTTQIQKNLNIVW